MRVSFELSGGSAGGLLFSFRSDQFSFFSIRSLVSEHYYSFARMILGGKEEKAIRGRRLKENSSSKLPAKADDLPNVWPAFCFAPTVRRLVGLQNHETTAWVGALGWDGQQTGIALLMLSGWSRDPVLSVTVHPVQSANILIAKQTH